MHQITGVDHGDVLVIVEGSVEAITGQVGQYKVLPVERNNLLV